MLFELWVPAKIVDLPFNLTPVIRSRWGGEQGLASAAEARREQPPLCKRPSARMSLGWKPPLAAVCVIVLNEWQRSNTPNARSHTLMSHAASLFGFWTCCHTGRTLSHADVPNTARGATRALVDGPMWASPCCNRRHHFRPASVSVASMNAYE